MLQARLVDYCYGVGEEEGVFTEVKDGSTVAAELPTGIGNSDCSAPGPTPHARGLVVV